MTTQQLITEIYKKNSFLCIGLDVDLDKIPKHYRSLDKFMKMSKSVLSSNFVKYLPNHISSKQTFLCNSTDLVSTQKIVWLSKTKNSIKKFTYVANNLHRIHL